MSATPRWLGGLLSPRASALGLLRSARPSKLVCTLSLAYLEELAGRVVNQVGEQNLDDNVGLGLLRLDVRGEIRLAAVDGRLHLLHGGATLGDVALGLPGELDIVGDVEVDGEIERLVDAVVVHGVEALEDDDRLRRDRLVLVELARDVVVDRLHDVLAGLEVGDVRVHLVPVLARLVQGGDAVGPLRVGLAARAVPLVVIVKADDRGHVGDEGVRLTANVVELRLTAEDRREAAHEGRLAAAGVGGNADHDRLDVGGGGHGDLRRARDKRARRHRGTRREANGEGSDGVDHCVILQKAKRDAKQSVSRALQRRCGRHSRLKT